MQCLAMKYNERRSYCADSIQASSTNWQNWNELALYTLQNEQGSDTRVRTQKNPVGFVGYTHLKKPTPKKPTLLL